MCSMAIRDDHLEYLKLVEKQAGLSLSALSKAIGLTDGALGKFKRGAGGSARGLKEAECPRLR